MNRYLLPLLVLIAGAALFARQRMKKKPLTIPAAVMGVGAAWLVAAYAMTPSEIPADTSGDDYGGDDKGLEPPPQTPPAPLPSSAPPVALPPPPPPPQLSPMEQQLSNLVQAGKTTYEIAGMLGISMDDVSGLMASIDEKEQAAAASAAAWDAMRQAQIAEAQRMAQESAARSAQRVAALQAEQRTAEFPGAPKMSGTAKKNRDAALVYVEDIMPPQIELRTMFTFGKGAEPDFWKSADGKEPITAVTRLVRDWLASSRPDRFTLTSRLYTAWDRVRDRSTGAVIINGKDATAIFNEIARAKG